MRFDFSYLILLIGCTLMLTLCMQFTLYIIIIIIINKVLINVTLNKVIAGALYIVICG